MTIALSSGSVSISTLHEDLATVMKDAKWKILISRAALKDRTAEQVHDLATDLEGVAQRAGYEAPKSK